VIALFTIVAAFFTGTVQAVLGGILLFLSPRPCREHKSAKLTLQMLPHLRYYLFPSIRFHLQEGGKGTIQRHSFICMSKLPDVRGRITYISSHAKQENLYAVYETTDRHYWTELAKCNQQEFQKSGTEGKCIEAREFIIALPESFPNLYEPDRLLHRPYQYSG